MEHIPHLENKELSKETAFQELMKKFRRIGIASAVAISSLLVSCEGGPKKEASAQTIENHIEKPNIEKISTEKIASVEAAMQEYLAQKQAANGYYHGRVYIAPDGSEWVIHLKSPTDSTIEINANLNAGPEKREEAFTTNVDMEFLKSNGAVLRYTERDDILDIDPNKKDNGGISGVRSESKSAYIVVEDGTVQSQHYTQGDAEKMIDRVMHSTKPSDAPRKNLENL